MALSHHIRRFVKDRSGAALVEFALALPLMLLVSYMCFDGLRLMWSYQAATAGVHEATRYLARVAPGDVCDTGATLTAFEDTLFDIVEGVDFEEDVGRFDSVFGQGVDLLDVSTSLTCVDDAGLRQAEVPVVTVTADLRLLLPFHLILSRTIGTDVATFEARIEEQARVYGL